MGNRVLAVGTAPLSYQWRLNGEPLAGQTKSTIILTDVQAADEGTYDVVITNLAGSVTSTGRVLVLDRAFTRSRTPITNSMPSNVIFEPMNLAIDRFRVPTCCLVSEP